MNTPPSRRNASRMLPIAAGAARPGASTANADFGASPLRPSSKVWREVCREDVLLYGRSPLQTCAATPILSPGTRARAAVMLSHSQFGQGKGHNPATPGYVQKGFDVRPPSPAATRTRTRHGATCTTQHGQSQYVVKLTGKQR